TTENGAGSSNATAQRSSSGIWLQLLLVLISSDHTATWRGFTSVVTERKTLVSIPSPTIGDSMARLSLVASIDGLVATWPSLPKSLIVTSALWPGCNETLRNSTRSYGRASQRTSRTRRK